VTAPEDPRPGPDRDRSDTATSGWWAPVLAVASGLALLGGSTAGWVIDETAREIGGVQIVDTATRTGAQVQPGLLVVGVALLLGGALLAFLRGGVRRVLGALLLLASVAGVGLAVVGLQRATALAGALQPVAWLPLVGAGAGIGAGLLAARGSGRRTGLPPRYDAPASNGRGTVGDAEPTTDEWELAADRDDHPAG
jgi:Tryptophan-associated transmembrane protein (Trp_oprn_chp)